MTKKGVRELNGYRLIWMPEHPRAMTSNNWFGYVYEHIVVVEKCLGRALAKNEVIHHLDENRSNNRSENLLILDNGQHTKLHTWLQEQKKSSRLPRFCKCCGITLQKQQKRYCSDICSAYGRRKVIRPTKTELKADIKSLSWVAIGKKYGVSDNATKKWARAYQLL